MSGCIWALSDEMLVETINQNNEPNAKNWIFVMHDQLTQKQYTLLVVTLWAIWRAKRKAIYEDIFQSPESINEFIISYINDLSLTETRGSSSQSHSIQRTWGWIGPPESYLKINVDATVSLLHQV